MQRKHNFSAGPAALPTAVLERAKREILDFAEGHVSVMEISHRSTSFKAVLNRAVKLIRELLKIPDNYEILFMHGGASAQFFSIHMNLLGDNLLAAYVNTGAWSAKAMKEAVRYCCVAELARLDKDAERWSIPSQSTWQDSKDAAYLHYTDNETISGVEFNFIPDTNVPLVCDMSSNIFSRQFDVSKFGVIYAGAQKNIGPSGLGLVIVRKDLLGRALEITPNIYNYAVQAKGDSMANTPPTFNIYMAVLCFEWLLEQGGVAGIEKINQRKADLLYSVIDAHSDVYRNRVDPTCRSRMNITFNLVDESLESKFLEEAAKCDCINLKGHRSVGGIRASIYNAVSMESVQVLADVMRRFAT